MLLNFFWQLHKLGTCPLSSLIHLGREEAVELLSGLLRHCEASNVELFETVIKYLGDLAYQKHDSRSPPSPPVVRAVSGVVERICCGSSYMVASQEGSRARAVCRRAFRCLSHHLTASAKALFLSDQREVLLLGGGLEMPGSPAATATATASCEELQAFFEAFVGGFEEAALTEALSSLLHRAAINPQRKQLALSQSEQQRRQPAASCSGTAVLKWHVLGPLIRACASCHPGFDVQLCNLTTCAAQEALSVTSRSPVLLQESLRAMQQLCKLRNDDTYARWFSKAFMPQGLNADDSSTKFVAELLKSLTAMVPSDTAAALSTHIKMLRFHCLELSRPERAYITLARTRLLDLQEQTETQDQVTDGSTLLKEDISLWLEAFERKGKVPAGLSSLLHFDKQRWRAVKEILLEPPSFQELSQEITQ
ncbi:unnamed protein product [Chrysoparadoxa australica]